MTTSIQRTRLCGTLDLSADSGTFQTLCGWLQDTRNLGGIAFMQLRDHTGVVQLTLPKGKVGKENFKAWTSLSRESIISVTGEVKANQEAPGGIEVVPRHLEVLNGSATPLPLGIVDKVDAELETRLTNRYLDLRKPEVAAYFRVRSAISGAAHASLRRQGFMEVQTPKIIASATEGGTGLFPVRYFEREVYLAQSPQLYKQTLMSGGLDRVYEIGPAFRAEEHNTPRHLNEFCSIDMEMAFADDEQAMEVMERVVVDTIGALERDCGAELARLGHELPDIELPLPRLTYDECVELARAKGVDIQWGEDLSMEATRVIAESQTGFYFITRWPLALKPFYIQPASDDNDGPDLAPAVPALRPAKAADDGTASEHSASDPAASNTTAADDEGPKRPASSQMSIETLMNSRYSLGFDFMYREVEMTSGGARVHDPALLEARIAAQDLDPADFEHYLAPFRYGMPPHAGWGLGLDRLTMVLTGADNVRECVLFPRDRHRVVP